MQLKTFELRKPMIIEDLETDYRLRHESYLNCLNEYLKLANRALKIAPNNEKVLKAKINIEKDIKKAEKGDHGEQQALYYLENSYIPMYILHGLYFPKESNGAGSQVDIIAITRKNIYLIECKNWTGNLFVNRHGNFEMWNRNEPKNRTSPYIQNKTHLNHLKEILNDDNKNADNYLQLVIVFANDDMLIEIDERTPYEISSKIIKVDMLGYYIEKFDKESNNDDMSDEQMKEYLNYFCQNTSAPPNKYEEKYSWLKKFVSRKTAFVIITSLVVILSSLIYIWFFVKFQTPKLMADADGMDLKTMSKIVLMIYSPLGVLSGILGFIYGLTERTEYVIDKFAIGIKYLITILTIAWTIYIEKPDSFFDFLIAIVLVTIVCLIWNIFGVISSGLGKAISKALNKNF